MSNEWFVQFLLVSLKGGQDSTSLCPLYTSLGGGSELMKTFYLSPSINRIFIIKRIFARKIRIILFLLVPKIRKLRKSLFLSEK